MSNIAPIAVFFIGLMTSLSPCPLTTNLAAIAYVSKNTKNPKKTALVGLVYTFGRALTYVILSVLIVNAGLSSQSVSLFLQKWGEVFLGPFLFLAGLVMLGYLKINLPRLSGKSVDNLKKFAGRGMRGALILGIVFALSFCPFSAVLFFGMLIPIALNAKDSIFLPAIFGIATGLPVVLLSLAFAKGTSTLGATLGTIGDAEKMGRKLAGLTFVLIGLYYCLGVFA